MTTLQNPTQPDIPGETLRDRLQALADEARGTYALARYDCGVNVTLTVPGKGSASVSIDCGEDDTDALALLRSRLTGAGLLGGERHQFILHYPGSRKVSIWAVDEQQAIRLAGQGQPEGIEEMSSGT